MQRITSSQTIGPFFHNALAWGFHRGTGSIELTGRVLDGNDSPINDAMVEIWMDEASGSDGFGLLRQPTDANGQFQFLLPTAFGDSAIAHVCVFARGCFNQHFTAVFSHDADHPLLRAVPSGRRKTLIATRESDTRYRWDLRLQGAQETVFFEYE